MITAAFHPILDQSLIGLSNAVRNQLSRPLELVFLSAAWLAVAGIAWLVYGRLPGEPIAAVVESATRSPWPTFALLGVFACWAQYAPLRRLRRHLLASCWAALPIAPARTLRTVLLLGLLQLTALLAVTDAALLAAAALVRNPERWLGPARQLALMGLGAGGVVGLALALGRSVDAEVLGRRWSHDSPLFPLPPLEQARLPVFAHWQRIETLRRFRAGGRWWQYVLIGCAIPTGITLPSLAGLVLMGVVLIWFGIATTTARETIVSAARLTAATPLRFDEFALATARYPLLAVLVAAFWGTIALLLQDAPLPFLAAWPVLAAGWCMLELSVAWHARRKPRHIGMRLAADATLIVGAAQAFLPLAGLAWAGLLCYHLVAANREP